MKPPTNRELLDPSLLFPAVALWMALLSCSVMLSQESQPKKETSAPVLSETTLKILEAQAQATIESPSIKTPEESELTTKEPRKLETGGLLKEWFAPFERKRKAEQKTMGSSSKTKRNAIWKWFDPTAPLTESELKAKPVDWRGQRVVPQSFGSPQKTNPEGLKIFFIRYK